MIALAIGALATAGAIALLLRARDSLAAVETNARLQETARYALAILESDVRQAGYWGLADASAPVSVSTPFSFPPKCGGAGWVVDPTRIVDGTNGSYLPLGACPASSGGHRVATDVLVVRRASSQRMAPQAPTVPSPYRDRVMIVSSRRAAQIFVPRDLGNALPAGFATADVPGQPPLADTREFLVNVYYVSAGSSVGAGYPALRRKGLVSGPDLRDEEIVPGVEDLQFRLGIDTTGDGNTDLFADPGSVPPGGEAVSVRIWLRLRAQDPDPAYVDDSPTTYAGRTVAATGDRHRRLLVSKTLQLRNHK